MRHKLPYYLLAGVFAVVAASLFGRRDRGRQTVAQKLTEMADRTLQVSDGVRQAPDVETSPGSTA